MAAFVPWGHLFVFWPFWAMYVCVCVCVGVVNVLSGGLFCFDGDGYGTAIHGRGQR